MVKIPPAFLPGFRTLIQETRSELEALNPPAVAAEVHADFEALIDEAADQMERGEANPEILQTFLGVGDGTQLGARFGDLANRLVAIAATEGIVLDLSAGALVADSALADPNAQPDTVVEVVAPRDAPVEPVDPLLPPNTPTGIAHVDEIVETILSYSGDFGPITGHLSYTSTGCTLETGLGGPPKCWEVPKTPQVEGARVEVFATSGCEGGWAPRGTDPALLLSGVVTPELTTTPDVNAATNIGRLRVYGVYQVPPVAEPSDWPAGDYAVVFAAQSAGGVVGSTVRIADGGIVSIELGCGPTPPAQFAAGFTHLLLSEPLHGLDLAGTGTVSHVDGLPSHATEETEPQWRAAIELTDAIGGYTSIIVDAGTEVVGFDGRATTVAAIESGQRIAIEGTPLPWSVWLAHRVVIVG